jgi:hypothetical protein
MIFVTILHVTVTWIRLRDSLFPDLPLATSQPPNSVTKGDNGDEKDRRNGDDEGWIGKEKEGRDKMGPNDAGRVVWVICMFFFFFFLLFLSLLTNIL